MLDSVVTCVAAIIGTVELGELKDEGSYRVACDPFVT
jgi:hypothetical protein